MFDRPNLSPKENGVNYSQLIKSKIEGFYELEKDPNKIIRVQKLSDIKEIYGENEDPNFVIELGRKLYKEIEEKYNIPAPVKFETGKNDNNEDVVYLITDKINGISLEEAESSPESKKQIEDTYISIAKYYADKYKNKEAHLADINALSQYVYGKRALDKEPKPYLVDTDLYINKGDAALLHNVKWLVRHLPFKIPEAEKYIREILEKPLAEDMSEEDNINAQNEINSSLNFLNGNNKEDVGNEVGFIPTPLR